MGMVILTSVLFRVKMAQLRGGILRYVSYVIMINWNPDSCDWFMIDLDLLGNATPF